MPRSSPSSPPPPRGEPAAAPPDDAAAREGLAHRVRALGVLAIEGADRVTFLQGQLTQEVRTLEPGRSRPAAGLTPRGKLLYWGRIWNAGDSLLLLLPARAREAVAAHLAKYAVFQKVSVRDRTGEHAAIGLYGPRAAGVPMPKGAAALEPEGEFAAEFFGPREALSAWEAGLARAGSVGVSEETAEVLRVEAGRPRLGQDADESNLPDEVGLEPAISRTKGCYVGQEVVARLRTYGRVNRRLVGFRFAGGLPPAGTEFPNPGRPDHVLARVSSVVRSPRFGAIGLGLAFRDVPDGGSLVRTEQPTWTAVVSPLPFS